MNTQRKSTQTGITLVELCMVLAIAAILFAAAAPSMSKFKRHQHLKTQAQTLVTDIQEARSAALRSGDSVLLRFSQHPQGTCYIVHTGAKGDCVCSDAGKAICIGKGQALKTTWIPAQGNTTVKANVQNMNFDGRQGLVTPAGSIDVVDSNGETIRQVVSITGRIRSCTTTTGFNALPKCTTSKAA